MGRSSTSPPHKFLPKVAMAESGSFEPASTLERQVSVLSFTLTLTKRETEGIE